jgi:hypothetical protein
LLIVENPQAIWVYPGTLTSPRTFQFIVLQCDDISHDSWQHQLVETSFRGTILSVWIISLQVTDVFLKGHSNSLVKIIGIEGSILDQMDRS